jgi:hypothetical protein
MKLKLCNIKETLVCSIDSLLDESRYCVSSQSENEAKLLKVALYYFLEGIASATGKGYNENANELFEVPDILMKYFLDKDPEYMEYKRLDSKFKNYEGTCNG